MLRQASEYHATLVDQYTPAVANVRVSHDANGEGINIGIDGYGDNGSDDGYGIPMRLEFREGKLLLHVWADINDDCPTHTICLDGAHELYRVPTATGILMSSGS